MNLSADEQKLIDRVNRWLKDSSGSCTNPYSRHYDPQKAADLSQKFRILARQREELASRAMRDADDLFAGL